VTPYNRGGAPGGVGDAGPLVGGAGEREEQVGEAVEIAHDLGADAGGVGLGQGDGAATDGAGEVQRDSAALVPRVGRVEGVDVTRRAGPANGRWAAIRRTVPS